MVRRRTRRCSIITNNYAEFLFILYLLHYPRMVSELCGGFLFFWHVRRVLQLLNPRIFLVIFAHAKIRKPVFPTVISIFSRVRVPSRAFFMQSAEIQGKPPEALQTLRFRAVIFCSSMKLSYTTEIILHKNLVIFVHDHSCGQ